MQLALEDLTLTEKLISNLNIPVLRGNDLFSSKQHVSITLSTAVPDYLGLMHMHDFIEITYIISGNARYIVYDQSKIVTKGDLIIINYQTPHAFIGEDNTDNPFVAYDLCFNPDFLDRSLIGDKYFEDVHATFLLSSLIPSKEIRPTIHLSGNGFDDFYHLYTVMYKEYQQKQRGFDDMLRAYLVELIIKIYRKFDDMAGNNPNIARKQMIETIIEYIHINFAERITLSDIAYRVFLHKDYLNRIFKLHTGVSFGVYLKQYRLERACAMLADTDETIDAVLLQSGFQDAKFFYTEFKKFTGMTPNEYRKKRYAESS